MTLQNIALFTEIILGSIAIGSILFKMGGLANTVDNLETRTERLEIKHEQDNRELREKIDAAIKDIREKLDKIYTLIIGNPR